MSAKRLLVIDDEASIGELIAEVAKGCDYEVEVSTTSETFKEKYLDFKPNVIFLDLQLGEPDIDGIQLLRFLADQNSKALVIVMSGFAEKIIATALRLGKTHGLNMIRSIQKPFKIADIISLLNSLQFPAEIPTTESLKKAIDEGNFVLHYQPKIVFKTQEFVGAEVLVRYKAPNQEMLYPDAFISIAEQSEVIRPLTWWIIKSAFQQLSIWQKKNLDFGLAINLSAKILDDLTLPDVLSQYVKEYNINPQKISFEITESVVMNKLKIVMDILVRLRLKGFNLSIDDFGTGYSSLVELYHMPFNEIKIDKSFIRNITHDMEAQIITRAIIDLGHNLGLITVAEGVENSESWDMLAKLKCDIAQGYFVTPPISAEELEDWLSSRTIFEHHEG